MDKLRRFYNAVDQWRDRGALLEELEFTRDCDQAAIPLTAGQALNWVLPAIREIDRGFRLKFIASQHGVDPAGASAHWEFFFDLLNRRAKAVGEWALRWDESSDGYGPAQVHWKVQPYPPANSPLRKMVNAGQFLHLQMVQLWKQEVARTPDLPLPFRDSDAAIAEFARQGLDFAVMEFSLSTGHSPQGELSWVAQTRRKDYYASLMP